MLKNAQNFSKNCIISQKMWTLYYILYSFTNYVERYKLLTCFHHTIKIMGYDVFCGKFNFFKIINTHYHSEKIRFNSEINLQS